ncbi:hypothetical protein K0B04_02620 [Patescibacteria group bacterium]|nr:hypothetical protein [Patescibacteria group bacterium]
MLFDIIIQFIFAVFSSGCKRDKDIPKFKNAKEEEAWIKEQKKRVTNQKREKHEHWVNVERPKLMLEAGLNPDNPQDVKNWRKQRGIENRKKRAEEEAEKYREIIEKSSKMREEEEEDLQKIRAAKLHWLKVERPRLMKEAGLDPNNPEDLKTWNIQGHTKEGVRKAEEKALMLVYAERSKKYKYTTGSGGSSSSPSFDYSDWSDREYEEWQEKEDNKLTVGKFIGSLFWD